jgi:hypothetical protein
MDCWLDRRAARLLFGAGLLGAGLVLCRLAMRVHDSPYAVLLVAAAGVVGTAGLKPRTAQSCLGELRRVRFRLRTAFIVIAAICATCALAPALRDYLVLFFATFFSLVVMGRLLVG